MGAAAGPRRKGRNRIVGINITPMVDVVLVLLVIMMVSAKFIVSQSIKVDLPNTGSSDGSTASLAAITLTKEGKTFFNSEPVDESQLVAKLQNAYAGNHDVSLIVSADKASVALLRVQVPVHSDPVVITFTSVAPPPPRPPPPAKAPEPAPEAAPTPKPAPVPHVVKPAAPKVAAAKAAPPPPAAAPPPAAPATAVPEFGVQLGGPSGPGGIAVPTGDPGGAPTTVRHAASKVLSAAPAAAANDCSEPPTKPHLLNMPQPVFPAEARTAGVQGKVRVRITVDAAGAVADAKVIEGLGHGCDEAALEAARTCRFDPALRCGAPVAGSITMGFTF
jgi:TonB family protein